MSGEVSASDWIKGIGLSVIASLVGGVSKLSLRKSWLLLRSIDTGADGEDSQSDDSSEASNGPDGITSTESHRRGCLCCRKTHARVESIQQAETRKIVRMSNLLSFSGMVGMSVLNPICCVLAMRYASPSILAPFSGLTLVWVILFSYSVLSELPSSSQVIAASFIVTGEVLVAVFGDHTNDDGVTIEQIKNSYLEPGFLVYSGCLVCYLLLMACFINNSKGPLLRKFAWGTAGGTITGLQNFLKDLLTILKASSRDGHPLPWFFSLFVVLAGGTAFSGLLILNQCMKRYDATYSAATFVGAFVLSASIMSAVHYNTIRDLSGISSYVLYPFGLFVLLVGVAILVRDKKGSAGHRDGFVELEQDHDGAHETRIRAETGDSQTPFCYQKVVENGSESTVPSEGEVV